MEEKRRERAARLFGAGANCAQAVLCACCDVLDTDERSAARLASALGGGMGRLREVCGAVSAMFLVLGAKEGCDLEAAAGPALMDEYARVQQLAALYREKYGSILCRELLERLKTEEAPPVLTADGKAQRPCIRYVLGAIDMLEREILNGSSGPSMPGDGCVPACNSSENRL